MPDPAPAPTARCTVLPASARDPDGWLEREVEIRRSRFLTYLGRVEDEAQAREMIAVLRRRHHDARHVCSAFVLGPARDRMRSSDDGEPAGTAGQPMLEVLRGSGALDITAVVVRYFGGVLLGTGGLVRAYTTATSRALEAAEVVTVRSVVALDVTVDYGLYERADLLIRAAGGKLAEPEFTDKVTLRWQMPEHTEGPLLTQLQELTRGTANVTVSEPFYAAF